MINRTTIVSIIAAALLGISAFAKSDETAQRKPAAKYADHSVGKRSDRVAN